MPERRNTDHRQRVINHSKEQRPAQAAEHATGSAHGADAADDAGGDHLQFKTVGDIDIGDSET